MTQTINIQKPSARIISGGDELFVHSIFVTIQGEGLFSGMRSVFIRLAGCNLQCPQCDTEYTSDQPYFVDHLVDVVKSRGIELVVLTGGEPFRQNVVPLIRALARNHIHTQIESNGALRPQHEKWVWELQKSGDLTIILSPKTSRIYNELAKRANAYKYVLSHNHIAGDGLPTQVLGHPLAKNTYRVARPPEGYEEPIFLQPADEGDPIINELNVQAVVKIVIEHENFYILCLQLHKILGLE